VIPHGSLLTANKKQSGLLQVSTEGSDVQLDALRIIVVQAGSALSEDERGADENPWMPGDPTTFSTRLRKPSKYDNGHY
jgi:hypothetical protein